MPAIRFGKNTITYCGEVHDNKYHGFGISYYDVIIWEPVTEYEGEWHYGLKHGKGTSYNVNGQLWYSGEWRFDQFNGTGTLYDDDENIKYVGSWSNGEYHRKGIEYKNGKITYDGEYRYGLYHGIGIWYYSNGNKCYEGEFKNGLKHGKGIEYYDDGTKYYEGEFRNGLIHGIGTEYFDDGTKYYEGEYHNGSRHGKGIVYNNNGTETKFYEGYFFNGHESRKGIVYYENGNIKYKGEFFDGDENGKGIEYYENGNKKYDGIFSNGLKHGKGTEYFDNGNKKGIIEYYYGKPILDKITNFTNKITTITPNYGKIDNNYIQFPKYYTSKIYPSDGPSIQKPYSDEIEVSFDAIYYHRSDRCYRNHLKVLKYNVKQKYNILDIVNFKDDEYLIYMNIVDKYDEILIRNDSGKYCECKYCKYYDCVRCRPGGGYSNISRQYCYFCNILMPGYGEPGTCGKCSSEYSVSRECKSNIFIPSGTYSVLVCTNYGNVYNITMNETKIIETDKKITIEQPTIKVDNISNLNVKLNDFLIDLIKVNYDSNYQFVKNYVEQTNM